MARVELSGVTRAKCAPLPLMPRSQWTTQTTYIQSRSTQASASATWMAYLRL
ncbi:hypothetical protein CERSUDRAFT_80764 [Gelatoporia subvermispora B]|uniref:Uncharacterized protein n=1 Tax=Ceriporiopsis subvermispora (strain B) TaxID=914234 RepID=M2R9L9_CERS8|nr:hypothetical protein CERSUDRAFT_80764 [Gelatoporia subvermispora B]